MVPVTLAALVLLLAVLGAGLRGPWTADPPGAGLPEAGTPPPVTVTESETALLPEEVPTPTDPPLAGIPAWASDTVLALAIAALLGLVALGAWWLWRRRRTLRTDALRAEAAGTVSALEAGEDEEVPDLSPALRRAAAALGAGAAPADAIVGAWVALEETAAASGAARSAADTPTEFTTRLLHRTAADPDAVARLRDVYRAARFGSRAPTDDDVAAAAAALERIESTWEGR
ncbi:hypothetical protein SERN_0340 [Serinibacter arcticus]|uniref:Protein-glutamine gamma-glutamyltransferase-like C-terminal domain-containing protein n=1 Tax=Serinibacter arcticus TaxID=1655435 RepID=A0A4Z1E5J2_9MICO|nr:hypothetical protein SERN_0340 [Serinibacter arcticus]